MAKAMKKLPDFFAGHRKECKLIDYRALVSKGDEKRIKMTVEIKLSGGLKQTKHMPDQFVDLFGIMEREESTTNLCKEAVQCEDMTVDIFATDTGPKTKTVTGCSMLDFRLVGEGEKDKRVVTMEFIIYMPADRPLNEWAFGHLHKTFFIEAVPAQAELPLSTSTAPAKSTALAVIPPANGKAANGKSGDKTSKAKADFKAHHDAQVNKGKTSPTASVPVQ